MSLIYFQGPLSLPASKRKMSGRCLISESIFQYNETKEICYPNQCQTHNSIQAAKCSNLDCSNRIYYQKMMGGFGDRERSWEKLIINKGPPLFPLSDIRAQSSPARRLSFNVKLQSLSHMLIGTGMGNVVHGK